jgi:predicted ATPase
LTADWPHASLLIGKNGGLFFLCSDQAQLWAQQNDEPYWDAELLRVRGDALLGRDRAALGAAEASYTHALEIARGQEAKLLELRAASSLARLWVGMGRRSEARELLAPVYEWFTEGYDTLDLQEAKRLLDTLS